MKLHLPKQLFTALIACFSAVSVTAAEITGTFSKVDTNTTTAPTLTLGDNAGGLTASYETTFTSHSDSSNPAVSYKTGDYYRPDINIHNTGFWELTFNLTNSDADATVYINSITLNFFTFNSANNYQDNERYVDVSLADNIGDELACETDKELVRNGTSTEVEFNPENKSIATLIGGENASSDSFTVKVTKATTTSHNVGTFVGLKDITLVTSATIKSGANVTWTNGTNATWSGESWKTAAGTIGTMADAKVGNATFVGVANDDSTINDYTVTVDTAATAKSIAVSSGNYTFSGTGTLSITNEDVTNDEYSLNIAAGASATFNVATTLAGTVSNAGTLTFGSNLTVDTSLSLSGNIVLKDTIYNNGTLNLAEGTEIRLDTIQNFDIKTDGGSVHILNEVLDGEGNLTTNTNGNGFEYILSTKYWLVKGADTIDGLQIGAEYPLCHVNGTDTYQLAQDTSEQDGDGLGFYFDSGNYTLYDNYYIKSGDVEVGTAVQELVQTKASTYVLNGGTMKITEGTVNTSDIAYDSGNIKVASGAKLNYDAEADGLSIVELLTGSVITYDADATPGTLLISMDGLDTGNVALTTSFKGTLELAAGTTFTLGCKSTGSDADAKDVNTKSITGFVLNSGSNLQYQGTGANAQFNNLTVQGSDVAATFKVLDTHATADDVVKLTGTTTLDNDLNLQFQYGGSISIESLAGTGKLSASRVGDSTEAFSTTIDSLSNFEGEIEFSSTAYHTVVINTGNVGEGKSSIRFSSLTASTGTGGSFTFNVQDNTSIGQLNVVSGLVTVSAGKSLTLGGGTSEAPVTHSIGQLNAAGATVDLAAYTTLTLGGGTSEAPVTHSIGTVNAAGTTTIQLNDNAKLDKITKTGSGTIALKGSGVYDLGQVTSLGTGNNSIGNVVGVTVASLQDATAWTGTVRLHGTTEGAMLHNLGNSNSWVEVAEAGLTGKLHTNTNAGDVVPNIRLTGNLELNSTNAGDPDYKYIGDFAGAGKYIVSYTNEKTRKYEFAGNVAEWTGAFEQTETAANAITTVKFSGEAKDINTEISNAAGTLNLEIDTTEGAALSKNVNVTKLQVNNGKTATLSGESNSITAGNVTISRQNATMSNVTVQGSSISATATDGTKGSISNANVALAQLQEDASFTIQDMTLTNTTITAATVDTKVKLQNVEASNVVLDKGKFSTDAPMSVVAAGGSEGTAGTFSATTSLLSGITINASAGASLAVDLGDLSCVTAMGPGKYDLSITLSGVGFDSYENLTAGSGIIFTADSWLGQLLTAQGATAYVSGAVETPASVSEGGSTGGVSVSYSAATGENVGTVITITGLNVPEPATSTLSLLALAALAARRRRKA